MFRYMMEVFGEYRSAPLRMVLLSCLAAVVLTVLLVSFVRWLRRRNQDRPESWMGLVTSSLGNVLKVLAGLAILVAMGLYLRFESEEFSRKRGGVSERNYQAVEKIWGRPHEQNGLSAWLVETKKKYLDKDGLEFNPEKLKASEKLVAFREQKIEELIPCNLIRESDHDIRLKMNYRRKGNATYPGFEVDCRFAYTVQNTSDKDGKARFVFPLPIRQGLVDKLIVTKDGKDLSDKLQASSDSLQWDIPMKKGQEAKIEISYHSRGLDHIRLIPGQGQQQKYHARMLCQGVQEQDLNYPIGCMTPTAKHAVSDGVELEWNLDRAISRLGIGVILPKEKQAGYYVARVLEAAPWALGLLLAMVLVTHLIGGWDVPYVLLVMLGLAFVLYHLLMAHIGDYSLGLTGGMIVAGAILTILTAVLWFNRTGPFAAVSTVVFFLLFCIGYPLMMISEDPGLWTSILYVVLLAYVTVLLIAQKRLRVRS